jgi:hypothetical protein
MQKYNLQKRNQNPSRYYNSIITQVSTQAKRSSFQKPRIKIDTYYYYLGGQDPLSYYYYTLYNESEHNVFALVGKANNKGMGRQLPSHTTLSRLFCWFSPLLILASLHCYSLSFLFFCCFGAFLKNLRPKELEVVIGRLRGESWFGNLCINEARPDASKSFILLPCPCVDQTSTLRTHQIHSQGWMKSSHETVFCWVPVPYLTTVVS